MRIETRNFNLFTQTYVRDNDPGEFIPEGIPALWLNRLTRTVYIYVGQQNSVGIWRDITTMSPGMVSNISFTDGVNTATALSGVMQIQRATNSGLMIVLGSNIITLSIADDGVITSKIQDQAVTMPKLSTALQTAITNAQATNSITVNSSTATSIVDTNIINWMVANNVASATIAADAVPETALAPAVRTKLNAANTGVTVNSQTGITDINNGTEVQFTTTGTTATPFIADASIVQSKLDLAVQTLLNRQLQYNSQNVTTVSSGDNIVFTYDNSNNDLRISSMATSNNADALPRRFFNPTFTQRNAGSTVTDTVTFNEASVRTTNAGTKTVGGITYSGGAINLGVGVTNIFGRFNAQQYLLMEYETLASTETALLGYTTPSSLRVLRFKKNISSVSVTMLNTDGTGASNILLEVFRPVRNSQGTVTSGTIVGSGIPNASTGVIAGLGSISIGDVAFISARSGVTSDLNRISFTYSITLASNAPSFFGRTDTLDAQALPNYIFLDDLQRDSAVDKTDLLEYRSRSLSSPVTLPAFYGNSTTMSNYYSVVVPTQNYVEGLLITIPASSLRRFGFSNAVLTLFPLNEELSFTLRLMHNVGGTVVNGVLTGGTSTEVMSASNMVSFYFWERIPPVSGAVDLDGNSVEEHLYMADIPIITVTGHYFLEGHTTENIVTATPTSGTTPSTSSTTTSADRASVRCLASSLERDLPEEFHDIGETVTADYVSSTSWAVATHNIYDEGNNPLSIQGIIALYQDELDTASTVGTQQFPSSSSVFTNERLAITTTGGKYYFANAYDNDNRIWPGRKSYGTGSLVAVDDGNYSGSNPHYIFKLSMRIVSAGPVPTTDTPFIRHGIGTSDPLVTLRRTTNGQVAVSFQTVSERATTGASATRNSVSFINNIPVFYDTTSAVNIEIPQETLTVIGSSGTVTVYVVAVPIQAGRRGAFVVLNQTGFTVTNSTNANIDVNGYDQTFTIGTDTYDLDFDMDYNNASRTVTIANGRGLNANNVSFDLYLYSVKSDLAYTPSAYTARDIAILDEGEDYTLLYGFLPTNRPVPSTLPSASTSSPYLSVVYTDGASDCKRIDLNKVVTEPSAVNSFNLRQFRLNTETSLNGAVAFSGVESYFYNGMTNQSIFVTEKQLNQMYRYRDNFLGRFIPPGTNRLSAVHFNTDIDANNFSSDAITKIARDPVIEFISGSLPVIGVTAPTAVPAVPANTTFTWYSGGSNTGTKTVSGTSYTLFSDVFEGVGTANQSSSNIATLFDSRSFPANEIRNILLWTGAEGRSFNTFKVSGSFNITNITAGSNPPQTVLLEIWRPTTTSGSLIAVVSVLQMALSTSTAQNVTVQTGDILIVALRSTGGNSSFPRINVVNPTMIPALTVGVITASLPVGSSYGLFASPNNSISKMVSSTQYMLRIFSFGILAGPNSDTVTTNRPVTIALLNSIFGWNYASPPMGVTTVNLSSFLVPVTLDVTGSNAVSIVIEVWRPTTPFGNIVAATMISQNVISTNTPTSISLQSGDLFVFGSASAGGSFTTTSTVAVNQIANLPHPSVNLSAFSMFEVNFIAYELLGFNRSPLGKLISSVDYRLMTGLAVPTVSSTTLSTRTAAMFGYRFWVASELTIVGVQYHDGTSFSAIGNQFGGMYIAHFRSSFTLSLSNGTFRGTVPLQTVATNALQLPTSTSDFATMMIEIVRPTFNSSNVVTSATTVHTITPPFSSTTYSSNFAVQANDIILIYRLTAELPTTGSPMHPCNSKLLFRNQTTFVGDLSVDSPRIRTPSLPADRPAEVALLGTVPTSLTSAGIPPRNYNHGASVPGLTDVLASSYFVYISALTATFMSRFGIAIPANTLRYFANFAEGGIFSFRHTLRSTMTGVTVPNIVLKFYTFSGTLTNTVTLMPNGGFSDPVTIDAGVGCPELAYGGYPGQFTSTANLIGGVEIRNLQFKGLRYLNPASPALAGSTAKTVTNVIQPVRDITFNYESERDEAIRISESLTTTHPANSNNATFFVPFFINDTMTERTEGQPNELSTGEFTNNFIVNIRAEFYRRFEQENGNINIRLVTRPNTSTTTYTVADAGLNWEVRGREQDVTTTSGSEISAIYYCARVNVNNIGTARYALEGFGRQTTPAIPENLIALTGTTPAQANLPVNGITFLPSLVDWTAFRTYRVAQGSGNASLSYPITWKQYPTSLNALVPYIDRGSGVFENQIFYPSRPLLVQFRLRCNATRFESGTTPTILPTIRIIFNNNTTVNGMAGFFTDFGQANAVTPNSGSEFVGRSLSGNITEFLGFMILDRINATGGLDLNPLRYLDSQGMPTGEINTRGWTAFTGGASISLRVPRQLADSFWIDSNLELAELSSGSVYFATQYVASTITSFNFGTLDAVMFTKTVSGMTFGYREEIERDGIFYGETFASNLIDLNGIGVPTTVNVSLYIGKHRETAYSNNITFTNVPASGFASNILVEVYRFIYNNASPTLIYRRVHFAVLTTSTTEVTFEVRQGDIVMLYGETNGPNVTISSGSGL